MNGCMVVAAHGFRSGGRSFPTHVNVGQFQAWATQCKRRLGGFGDARGFARMLAGSGACATELHAVDSGPVLSFDDALESIEHVVSDLSVPAILFVVVNHVGKASDWPTQPGWVPRERCLPWPRIRELSASGWLVGAHTMSHPYLSRCSAPRMRYEVEASRKTIEDKLGQACDLFAYPYGDAPAPARRIVESLGMTGFGMVPGIFRGGSDRACLPRVDLFDLVRPGIAADWAWSAPGLAGITGLRVKRMLGRLVPRRGAA